jgi:3-phenylpropionate/trans-cinnamate dioxygenase ferredoxin reductase subunit
MSMVRFASASGLEIPVTLVCSSITYDHAFYREELALLAIQHCWLRVVHSVTRDPHETRALYHRRIDATMLSEVLNGTIPPHAYLCGPPAMVETAAAALNEFGVNPERVYSEKYD